MPISEAEKLGIADLLFTEEQNRPTLLQVARHITQNVCEIYEEDALDFLYTHSVDAASLLNKRHITKEILFKYLHNRKVSLKSDFTKATLVNKMLEYWHNTYAKAPNERLQDFETTTPTTIATTVSNTAVEPAQYPIHLLARKFSEWFFEHYNKDELAVADFWSDARLMLRIAANDRCGTEECVGSDEIIQRLLQSKLQFGFYFNPNLSLEGVQGRMDVHGLVLVLVCGTLHTQQNCVGVFECTFGLLRDPFAQNNWKIKTVQCVLRSQGAPSGHSLCDSETLKDALTLPVPMGELI